VRVDITISIALLWYFSLTHVLPLSHTHTQIHTHTHTPSSRGIVRPHTTLTHTHKYTHTHTHQVLGWLLEHTPPSTPHLYEMRWLRLAGYLNLQVSFAEYRLFYRALLQKSPILLRSLRIVATPYLFLHTYIHNLNTWMHTLSQIWYIHVHTYAYCYSYMCILNIHIYIHIHMCIPLRVLCICLYIHTHILICTCVF